MGLEEDVEVVFTNFDWISIEITMFSSLVPPPLNLEPQSISGCNFISNPSHTLGNFPKNMETLRSF